MLVILSGARFTQSTLELGLADHRGEVGLGFGEAVVPFWFSLKPKLFRKPRDFRLQHSELGGSRSRASYEDGASAVQRFMAHSKV